MITGSVALATNLADEAGQNNHAVTTVTSNNNDITIKIADGETLTAYEPANFPDQGEGEWIILAVTTDVDDITALTCDGVAFTEEDKEEAADFGLGANAFILWIDATDRAAKTFILGGEGYLDTTFTISFE